MVNKRKQINFNFYTIALILITILASMFSAYPLLASADEIVYSNVLADFQKDKSFSVENYPIVKDDYSLQVIQVAESANNELFVYVYQPEANFSRLATCINMSIDKDGLDCSLYNLDYINSTDTLFKYKVQNFTIVDEDIRVYDITSIYRKFDEKVDAGLPEGSDNTIDEVSFSVAKVWTAQDHKGETIYTCLDTEVVTITDKYVGFVRYPDGTGFFETSCDSHFVVFSTDKVIDKLLEAEVYYTKQSVTGSSYISTGSTTSPPVERWSYDYSDIKTDAYAELDYTEKKSYTADGWFGYQHTYSWDRIQTVEDFLSSVNDNYLFQAGLFNVNVESKVDETAKLEIENKQWVLRFAETDYDYSFAIGGSRLSKTIVGEVSILRLKFETNGNVYNLGVIDNKQTGSDEPINDIIKTLSLPWWTWLLIVFFALILLSPLLPGIFSFIFKCIVWLFKGIWWIFTSPIKIFEKDGK